MTRTIPLAAPWITPDDVDAVTRTLKSGWLVQGPQVREMEASVASISGAAHARACSSCTTGLHLALVALGIGPGDDVLVPALSWIATANAVEYVGARPVFVDVLADSFNIDPEDLIRKATPATKAVIPVHLFGLPADMDPIMAAARKNNWAVIEDAACAIGTTYKGQPVGSIGDAGVFSFHARKIVTAAEGGIVVTNSDALAESIGVLRSHGAALDDLKRKEAGATQLSDFPVIGFNYRMTDIQAALGVSQLARLPEVLRRRRTIARHYIDQLQGIPGLRTPAWDPEHTYQSFIIHVGAQRNEIAGALKERGIQTSPATVAMHTTTAYKAKYGFSETDFPVALEAERMTLSLPIFATLSREDQDYVIDAIKEVIGSMATGDAPSLSSSPGANPA